MASLKVVTATQKILMAYKKFQNDRRRIVQVETDKIKIRSSKLCPNKPQVNEELNIQIMNHVKPKFFIKKKKNEHSVLTARSKP